MNGQAILATELYINVMCVARALKRCPLKLVYQLDDRKLSKASSAKILIDGLRLGNFELLVINRSSFLSFRQKPPQAAYRGRLGGYQIALLDGSIDEVQSITWLSSLTWHKPHGHFAVCHALTAADLDSAIQQAKDILDLEERIAQKIVFHIDPVDDYLEFYTLDLSDADALRFFAPS